MSLTLKTAMVPIDTDLSSLNAWIAATTVNSIESIVAVSGQFIIIYT